MTEESLEVTHTEDVEEIGGADREDTVSQSFFAIGFCLQA